MQRRTRTRHQRKHYSTTRQSNNRVYTIFIKGVPISFIRIKRKFNCISDITPINTSRRPERISCSICKKLSNILKIIKSDILAGKMLGRSGPQPSTGAPLYATQNFKILKIEKFDANTPKTPSDDRKSIRASRAKGIPRVSGGAAL